MSHVRRVPKRYRGVDARRLVFTALRTGDQAEARAKVPDIERLQDAVWEARLAGDAGRELALFDRLREIAEVRGFAYVPGC